MKVKLKPCPFCGSKDLHTGPQGSGSQGINCWVCEALIAVPLPHRSPKGCKTLKSAEKWCLQKAIEKWNKRINEKNK